MSRELQFVDQLVAPLRVPPGSTVELERDFDPGYTGGIASKSDASARLQEGIALLVDYQDRLSAQHAFGVLLALQGLDASGKDSTIKHVMSGVNPQGVKVKSFKEPSSEELEHDFIWRHERAVPGRGRIGIHNRSHYEEVLIVRVHPELLAREGVPDARNASSLWARRYREINDWERYLVENGIRVVKVLLNLSREEQAKRFLRRIERPDKNWKFSAADIREREHWDDYQRAFDDMLSHTSTEWAPWYVVAADHKWFSRLATAAILVHTLAEIDPQYPRPGPEALEEMARARAELQAEMNG
ncbi:MAG TPA: polyphosphate kinase 2 family protein [Solirubrobacteraceae bacterium]|jgi:PPK2 family polyphosphate:nucleotide phosphotransferase